MQTNHRGPDTGRHRLFVRFDKEVLSSMPEPLVRVALTAPSHDGPTRQGAEQELAPGHDGSSRDQQVLDAG